MCAHGWYDEALRQYLTLQTLTPDDPVVPLLLASAAQGLLGTTETIGRLRGRLHDFRGVPVLCTYHPAFLLYDQGRGKRPDVLADLRLLLRRLRGGK